MTHRITCPRCGNANPLDAIECLACGRVDLFVASRDLPERDFETFSAASWLHSLNSTKAYAYRHGVELE